MASFNVTILDKIYQFRLTIDALLRQFVELFEQLFYCYSSYSNIQFMDYSLSIDSLTCEVTGINFRFNYTENELSEDVKTLGVHVKKQWIKHENNMKNDPYLMRQIISAYQDVFTNPYGNSLPTYDPTYYETA